VTDLLASLPPEVRALSGRFIVVDRFGSVALGFAQGGLIVSLDDLSVT
jgi:hypothetical protein